MRQLDLFGSYFETPEKGEKTEDIQLVLKKEDIPAVIVNKEISSFLVDITTEIPETKTSKDSQEINKNAGKAMKAGMHSEPFTLPENTDQQISPALADNEEPAENLPVIEAEVGQQIIFPQDQKELQTDHFDENEEVEFQDGKNIVQTENEGAFVHTNTETYLKKELQKRGRKSLNEIEAEADLIEVPEDDVLFKKQYYPISEVAKWFRVNTSLLRFWEKEFDILKPKKNGKGDRLFRPEDVKNLQLIYQLLRQRKYTIEGAKEYLKTNKKKADAEMQLANTLQKFKSFLLDLKANL